MEKQITFEFQAKQWQFTAKLSGLLNSISIAIIYLTVSIFRCVCVEFIENSIYMNKCAHNINFTAPVRLNVEQSKLV